MNNSRCISILVIIISILSSWAGSMGILSPDPVDGKEHISIRGERIEIYGAGIYRQMSSKVAVQGIAQDYVTIFLGVPLLLISLFLAVKGSLKGRFMLAGTVLYFLVTYLFYLCMAMYNEFFLVYAILIGSSFFCLLMILSNFELNNLKQRFSTQAPVRFSGYFLIVNSILIALLWLKVVLPPLLDGSVYPQQLEHYTTLIVQGLDLGLMLPLTFISGVLLIKRTGWGLMAGLVFLIFLSLLMTALTAKLIGMYNFGANVMPAIIIIPIIDLIAIFCSIVMLNQIKKVQN